MKQYLDLLRDIRDNGAQKGDRTGTGTTSLFGYQMRFDLSEGFPLLTTKRIWLKGVMEELRWFLQGSANVADLHPDVQKWWTPWALEDGDLGPIYGVQLRRSRWWQRVERLIYEPYVPEKQDGLFCGVGDLGCEDGRSSGSTRGTDVDRMLKSTWRDIIKRCYDEAAQGYSSYGAKGVHMDPAWLRYPQFKKDAMRLDGWELKRMLPSEYSIDKDIKHASNRYGPDTCIWANHKEQSMNTSTNMPFYATSPSGKRELFPSLGDMREQYGVNISAAHRCLRGKLRTHHGWSEFKYADNGNGSVLRFREMDQLANALALILYSPNSRRNVINLWHSPAMGAAMLPCCHGGIIQFYVANGKLSCQMYQRSADVFIGVPVNIASYALLTHMLAHVTGLEVGDFVHTFGDVHIYNNHREQVRQQLSREPRALPKLTIKSTLRGASALEDLLSIEYGDLHLEDYEPHPSIKAPVAV